MVQQDDIRTSIAGYKVLVDGQYVELKDYCPVFKDCTVSSITYNFKDDFYSSKSIQGVSKYFQTTPYTPATDNWVKGYFIPYRADTTSIDSLCVAGYKPQFQELYAIHDENFYVLIEKTSTKLIIRSFDGDYYFEATASDFKDRVLPKRLLVVMQGGGGGGCGSHALQTGNGGGAGGHVCGIINLEKTGGHFEVFLGYGGLGGLDASGGDGHDTQLTFKKDNGTHLLMASALGGKGGKKDSKGLGGGYFINYNTGFINEYFYALDTTYFSGGNGGTGGNMGESTPLETLYSTNHPTDKNKGINKTIIGGFDGGPKQGINVTTGGSGGASAFAEGGRVYGGGALGGDGSRGSGGGGGSFSLGVFVRGGRGGNGSVIFYY